MNDEPPRPHYDPKLAAEQRARRESIKPSEAAAPSKASVVPVVQWTFAQVLFWKRDKKKTA